MGKAQVQEQGQAQAQAPAVAECCTRRYEEQNVRADDGSDWSWRAEKPAGCSERRIVPLPRWNQQLADDWGVLQVVAGRRISRGP